MSDNFTSESELESLHDEDGNLMEQSEGQEEETQEEQAEPEKEENEQEEAGEEDAPLDWDSLDPRFKSAWEKAAQEAQKWQKEHGKIQSRWTKDAQTRKEMERSFNEYKQKAEVLAKWESLLQQYPGLEEVVQKEIARRQSPFGQQEVPDYLKEDPAYKHIMGTFQPYVQQLEQKLRMLEEKTGKIDQYEKQTQEQQYRKQLDTQLDAARQKIKSIFGRDATEDEVTEVLEYMVENKYYGNGAIAAMSVFGDKYEQEVKRRYDTELKEKAKKFPPRNKSVNVNRAQESRDHSSVEEAIAAAFAEQGA